MTTSTKSRSTKSTPAPAKRSAKPAAKPEAKKSEAPEVKETEAPKAPSKPTFREVEDFTPALKAAKGVAKGNTDLTQPLQLITHLAWKTPGGSVGWAKGTTPQVIAYADDIAVPEGTSIPDAMAAALSAARKAAADKPQTDAVDVLAKVIEGHTA
jgi:hypothetical protein